MTDEEKTPAALQLQDIVVPRSAEVMAISVSSRIPDFWVDQPRVWFIRTEAVLTPQKISDDAKFDMVVSKLPKEVILRLTDFLTNPPSTNKYQELKAKLLKMLEDSKNRQVEKVLGEMDLGEQKPSQLLAKMRNLAKDSFPDATLRIMWQNHLPTAVRAVLVASRETDLDTLASIADDVSEATRNPHVAAVAAPQGQGHSAPARTPGTADTAVILAEIAKLSVRMMDLERSRPRTRNFGRRVRGARSTSRHRSGTRPRKRSLYFYDIFFLFQKKGEVI
ncbi:uncharacterized protein LOC133523052 [Cydia pomonella]|uniref:uncharacterized protein LOC133523052 n=1 Tax=Cydia pomonella TaxID=82600 RepID=UPI002ADD3CDD|nr:uncharacterized protein LOC133523052 [Cydia pomonella]